MKSVRYVGNAAAAGFSENDSGQKGAIKVRVIIAYHGPNVLQARPDWPNVGYDFRSVIKNMTDALNIQVPDVEFIPTSRVTGDYSKMVGSWCSETHGQGFNWRRVTFSSAISKPTSRRLPGKSVTASSTKADDAGRHPSTIRRRMPTASFHSRSSALKT